LQTSVCDEEVCKGWVADIGLKLEDSHFAHGIFIAAQTLNELGDVDSFHFPVLNR